LKSPASAGIGRSFFLHSGLIFIVDDYGIKSRMKKRIMSKHFWWSENSTFIAAIEPPKKWGSDWAP
jgi:hypothetical protein